MNRWRAFLTRGQDLLLTGIARAAATRQVRRRRSFMVAKSCFIKGAKKVRTRLYKFFLDYSTKE